MSTPEEVSSGNSGRIQTDCWQQLELCRASIHTLETAMVEAKLRIEDLRGMKVEMDEVSKRVMPKPVNWWVIVLPALGLLMTLLGFWWTLSEKIAMRPMAAEVRAEIGARVLEHASSPSHPSIINIHELREEQVGQRAEIRSLRATMEEIKLDIRDIKSALRSPNAPH